MALMEKGNFLAMLKRPSTGNCPICYGELDSPFVTTCGHTFCRECLRQWLEDSHTCPACRHELYERPEKGDEDDEEDEGIDEEDSRVIEWIDLDVEMEIERDSVEALLRTCRREGLEGVDYDAGKHEDFVQVHCQSCLHYAVVAMLWMKPHTDEAHGPSDLCHEGWKTTMTSLCRSLRSLHYRIMSSRALFAELFNFIERSFRTADGQRGVLPQYNVRGQQATAGNRFRSEVRDVCNVIVSHARDNFEEANAVRLRQGPYDLREEINRLDLPFMVEFSELPTSGPDLSALITEQTKFDAMGTQMLQEEDCVLGIFCYLPDADTSYSRLLPLALAALIDVKMTRPLSHPQVSDSNQAWWRDFATSIEDLLFEVQFDRVGPVVLFQRLIAACSKHLKKDSKEQLPKFYGAPPGCSDLGKDVSLILKYIMLQAVRLEQLEQEDGIEADIMELD